MGLRPDNFPQISGGLTGSIELYTQTNGVNEKFTMDDVASYVVGDSNISYVEVELTPAEITSLNTTPVTLIDVSTLNLAANEVIYIEDLIYKYNYNTAAYTSALANLSVGYTNGTRTSVYRTSSDTFLNQAYSTIAQTAPQQDYLTFPQDDVELSSSRAISGGDGTLIVAIWYRIISL